MLLASDSQVAAKPFTKSGILQPTQTGDLIKGGTADLDLGALVDDIPVSDLDLHGAKGMKADEKGLERLRARQASADARAKEKYAEIVATETLATNEEY